MEDKESTSFNFAGIHKEDKRKIKQLLRQYIPDLFFTPRQEMSDDEEEDERGKNSKYIRFLHKVSRYTSGK